MVAVPNLSRSYLSYKLLQVYVDDFYTLKNKSKDKKTHLNHQSGIGTQHTLHFFTTQMSQAKKTENNQYNRRKWTNLIENGQQEMIQSALNIMSEISQSNCQ